MAVVKELIRTEENGAISFGDYELAQKSKLSDYQHQGDMYKVKTFKEITKLERNGMFVILHQCSRPFGKIKRFTHIFLFRNAVVPQGSLLMLRLDIEIRD